MTMTKNQKIGVGVTIAAGIAALLAWGFWGRGFKRVAGETTEEHQWLARATKGFTDDELVAAHAMIGEALQAKAKMNPVYQNNETRQSVNAASTADQIRMLDAITNEMKYRGLEETIPVPADQKTMAVMQKEFAALGDKIKAMFQPKV